jgi:hypothetical protein
MNKEKGIYSTSSIFAYIQFVIIWVSILSLTGLFLITKCIAEGFFFCSLITVVLTVQFLEIMFLKKELDRRKNE